jgi:hypothetical protein
MIHWPYVDPAKYPSVSININLLIIFEDYIMQMQHAEQSLSHSLTHSLTHSLHGAGYYFKSWLSLSLSKKSCFIMEPEGSLPNSHKLATEPYPVPAESSLPH